MNAVLPWWVAVPVAALLVLSGLISLIGSLGLLRLSHFYSRIHSPTMGNTLGIFCMLIAVILSGSFLSSRPIVHPLIITLLLVITSPVTAIFLMRAAIKRELRQRLADYAPDEPGYMSVPSKHPLRGAPIHPDE